jgi:hypothetical protein
MPLKAKFLENCYKALPTLKNTTFAETISENLLSPFQITLPRSCLDKVQNFVKVAFEMRQQPTYMRQLTLENPQMTLFDPGNNGIMMSYDFHIQKTGEMKLIEINTNAAFLGMSEALYPAHSAPAPIKGFKLNDLKKCIEQELILNGHDTKLPSVAIVDDQPSQQRLYSEFLLFQALFHSWGWNCEILDYREDLSRFDFIYNRLTDFYLTEPQSKALLDLFKSKKTCLSPHPLEYFLLADKNRLIDWQKPGFLENYISDQMTIEFFKSLLPKSELINDQNEEHIWAQRKNSFFKPLQAFGAKQTYKGSSISRGHFSNLVKPKGQEQFIAQEYVPAGIENFDTPQGPQEFKFDVRFYAYQDQLQSVVARIYQGQVTNLKTPLGGFAPVLWA